MDGFEDPDAPPAKKPTEPKAAAQTEVATQSVPGADLEAEECLLGALLMHPEKILPIAQLLGTGGRGVFSQKQNDQLYEILVKMAGEGEAIDVVTVGHRMHAEGKFVDLGMRSRLVMLIGKVFSAAHARHYAGIIRNRAVLRRFTEIGVDIARRAPEVPAYEEEISQFTAEVEEAIRSDFGRVSTLAGPQEMSEVWRKIGRPTVDEIAEARNAIRTGLMDVDELVPALTAGNFLVVGARTGGGKTSFELGIVANALRDKNRVVLYFSMEMSAEELTRRMVVADTGIPLSALKTGNMQQSQWDELNASLARREGEHFIVDETAHPTVQQVKHSAERIRARYGRLDLIVCDGIQLMKAKAEHRSEEIGRITRGLKATAKELQCPLVGSTQLNRGEGREANGIPYLRDIKESSSIEQDADCVVLLWRPDGRDKSQEMTSAKANVAKNRNGPTGMVPLTWDGERMVFRNYAPPIQAFGSALG